MTARRSSIQRFLLSPRTVFLEIIFFGVLALLSLVIGVDQVVYSGWFLIVATAGLASLAVATFRMLRRDIRAMHSRSGFVLRGGTVLHLGLTGALLFSSIAMVSASQGIYVLTEGQTLSAGSAPVTESHGPVASEFVLPQGLTLLLVSPSWWESGEVQQISSEIALQDREAVTVSVNGSAVIGGVRYYQDQRFGPTYFLTLRAADGTEDKQRLDMPQPYVNQPSYLDAVLADGTLLRARCEAVGNGAATTLTLKLKRGNIESAPVSLTGADVQAVGDVEVQVDDVRRWTALVLVRQHGLWAAFLSFFIVGVGAVMMYAAPVSKARKSEPKVGVNKRDDDAS